MTTAPTGRLDAAAPPPARRRRLGVLRYLVAAVFTLLMAVATLPDLLFGLDHRSPFAQVISFRPQLLVGVAAVLVVLLVVLRFRRGALPFVAGTLVVLLVGIAMVAPRAIAGPLPAAGTPLTVLAFNTFEGSADVTALAELIRTARPDVIALEEAGDRFRAKLAPLIEPLGYRLHAATGPGQADVGGVIAVVSDRLGTVDVQVGHDTSTFPYVQVTGGGLGALRFVVFHSLAPVPGKVPQWTSDLALLQRWCAGPTPAVVAGDFNATLDHSALRAGMAGCADAASQRGDGLIPTWGPSDRTRAVGPQIDHVLATGGITAETFTVHDVPHSDHRAILSTLRLPG